MTTGEEISRRLADELDVHLAVEESDGRLVLSGLVTTDDEHERALELARELAGTGTAIDDNIEVTATMPAEVEEIERLSPGLETGDRELSEVDTGAMPGASAGYGEEALEPGDFQQDRGTLTGHWEPSGPTSAIDEDLVAEGDNVYVPPSDPVVGRNRATGREEVIGGLSPDSMEEVEVEPSAQDDELGDEAIADAIRRELREDAATTDLEVEVAVYRGVARLHGRVPYLDDAENAEEVASRVPGLLEVREELEVDALED